MPRDEPSIPIAFRLQGELDGIKRSFPIYAKTTRLGAHPSNDIVLSLSGISRHHAVLTADSSGIFVEDQESKNGILVNGCRTLEARLAPGDELTVGPVTLSLQATDPEDTELSLLFEPLEAAKISGEVDVDIRETEGFDMAPSEPSTRQPGWIDGFVRELSFPDGMVVGSSATALALYRELRTVSGGDYPVLIVGETGSGKELVASTLHHSSPRKGGPFIAINCAAIPAELLEAEMFGVVRGAATGVAPRAGCFQRAEGGTLFLDEVAEMMPQLQAKLLRALEYREVQPVGGALKKIDVRVLSATNAALEQGIARGSFRADLYYRLAASLIQVPPLRDRRDDLPQLIQHFAQIYAEELGVRLHGLTHRALMLLMSYRWPGNVRQLQHEIRRIVQHALPGQVIDASFLSPQLRSPIESVTGGAPSGEPPGEPEPGRPAAGGLAVEVSPTNTMTVDLNLKNRVAKVEREVIQLALQRTGGHRSRAAKLLDISRNTLAIKITQYGLG